MKTPKMKTLTIIGRRWFQKTYGNTYHTVVAIVNGKQLVNTDRQYGYGEQYISTAVEELEKLGYLADRKKYAHGGFAENLRQYCERKGITYVATCTEVARQKDL